MTGDCDSPTRRKIEIKTGIVNNTQRDTKLGFSIEMDQIY
jgi:hypothetical protein